MGAELASCIIGLVLQNQTIHIQVCHQNSLSIWSCPTYPLDIHGISTGHPTLTDQGCPIQASKHYVESLTISAEKIKEAASHKVKGSLYSCLLIMRLPSGSKRFNWHLETIHNCWE